MNSRAAKQTCIFLFAGINSCSTLFCHFAHLTNPSDFSESWKLCSGRGLAFCWAHTSACTYLKGLNVPSFLKRLEKISVRYLSDIRKLASESVSAFHWIHQLLQETGHLVGWYKRNAKDWLGHKNGTDCTSSPFRSKQRCGKAALALLPIYLFSGTRWLMHAVVAGTGLGSFLEMSLSKRHKCIQGSHDSSLKKILFLRFYCLLGSKWKKGGRECIKLHNCNYLK